MKVSTVRAEMFRTDGETDRHTDLMKLIVAYRDFANAANNVAICNVSTLKVPRPATRYVQTKRIPNIQATEDAVGLSATYGWSSNRQYKLHTKFTMGMRCRYICRLVTDN
jgi:hypothetical protein